MDSYIIFVATSQHMHVYRVAEKQRQREKAREDAYSEQKKIDKEVVRPCLHLDASAQSCHVTGRVLESRSCNTCQEN